MKQISSLLIVGSLMLSGCVSTANLPSEYQYVHEFPDLSADDGYKSSLVWLAQAFVSSNAVIQLEDPEEHRIIGRGVADVTFTFAPFPVRFLIEIEHREERARITFSQMEGVAQPGRTRGGPLINKTQFNAFERQVAIPMSEQWKEFVTAWRNDDW